MSIQMGREHPRTRSARRNIAFAVFAALALTAADAHAFDRAQAADAGIVGGAVLGSLLYTPAKIAYAGVGSLVGGAAWVFSGGDGAASKPIFDRAWGGDYFLTPTHLRDPGSIGFIGSAEPVYALRSLLPEVSATPPACDTTTVPVVYFASGSSMLTPQAKALLTLARDTLKSCPSLRFEIAAYTDTTGNKDTNRVLAERRADAVHGFLLDRGIGTDRLSVLSYGEADSENATPEGRALNRRVELVAHN